MISIFFVILGVIALIYSLSKAFKLIVLIQDKPLKSHWNYLFALVSFFLIGYLIYLYLLIFSGVASGITDFIASLIMLSGAVYVFIVIEDTAKLVKNLNELNAKITENSIHLEDAAKTLETNNLDLEKAKEALAAKNAELNITLAEFRRKHFKKHKKIIKKTHKKTAHHKSKKKVKHAQKKAIRHAPKKIIRHKPKKAGKHKKVKIKKKTKKSRHK